MLSLLLIFGRSASSATLKQHDESINSAAELLCRASGILSYLSETVIPRWESAVGEDIKGRPIELSRDVVTALSKSVLPHLTVVLELTPFLSD